MPCRFLAIILLLGATIYTFLEAESSLRGELDSSVQNNILIDPKQDQTKPESTKQDLTSTVSKPLYSTGFGRALYFLYGGQFDFYLDNLEGSDELWGTRTLYAVRVSPEIGLGIGKHSVMFGGFLLQNMGASTFPTKANISTYYAYNSECFSAYLGIFPRTKWQGMYPLSFFRKDFLFFTPNSNGMALQYHSTKSSLIHTSGEFIFDWFGGNLAKRYDEFFALFEGKVMLWDTLYARANGLVYHFKNADVLGQDGAYDPNNPNNPDTQLMDRILYNFTLGASFVRFLPYLDRADIGFSALGQLERKRRMSGLGAFYSGIGYQLDVALAYKGFGIEESYYFGKPQMRYFSEYGEGFYDGLPLYQATAFNRINAYYEYKNDFLKLNVSFMFYTFSSNLALQQMLTLTFDTHKLFAPKLLRRF